MLKIDRMSNAVLNIAAPYDNNTKLPSHQSFLGWRKDVGLLNQCPVNLKQRAIAYLTLLSSTDQSNQIQSSSNQISVSSTGQNTDQLFPQGTNITHTENPPESTKQSSDTKNPPVDFKNSYSSLHIRLIDNIPQKENFRQK